MLEKLRKNKWDIYVPLPLKGLTCTQCILGLNFFRFDTIYSFVQYELIDKIQYL